MKKYFAYMKDIAEKKKSKIVLALDLDPTRMSKECMINRAKSLIKMLNEDIVSVKINMHLLLLLSKDEISDIIKTANDYGLTTIADIKLNDIPATNQIAIYNLASIGFDAVIVNPIIGFEALHESVGYTRLEDMGIITLVFMSHKGAENTYGLKIDSKRLYQIFLEWSLNLEVDGMVVGATYPDIINYCYNIAKGKVPVYSPGIAVQGGDPSIAVKSGVEYLIIGRKIINANNPKEVTRRLKQSLF